VVVTTTGSGKDNNVVFVAGATYKVGSRVVQHAFVTCSDWMLFLEEKLMVC
jgi:NADPH-dependent curcumin reductase CurA